MKAAPDNQWSHHPPHLMIAVPDLKRWTAVDRSEERRTVGDVEGHTLRAHHGAGDERKTGAR